MTESGRTAADEIADLQPSANPDEVAEADADDTRDDVDNVDTRDEYVARPVDDEEAVDDADI